MPFCTISSLVPGRDCVEARWGDVPSHLARSSTLIGSSLGGSSWTGFLGAKLLGSEEAILDETSTFWFGRVSEGDTVVDWADRTDRARSVGRAS